MLTDLEIAQLAKPKIISAVAQEMGLTEEEFDTFGKYKAKVSLDVISRLKERAPQGKYIVVTSITPTFLGEGKTTTTIGLGMALKRLGHRSAICLRQPSLGPVFGIKGGAAGGGYSQVIPMEDLNLHLTGDTHAVTLAHNLLAAFIDNSMFRGNPFDLDRYSVTWNRVIDISDRALRRVVVGLGGREGGLPRETSFDISAASEVMAILSLTNSLRDLRERIGKIVVGTSRKGKSVTAEDLHCAGAMTALLTDAIRPNLMQTLECTPAFVHTGPFGTVAHGNSSILADQIALSLNDYVVTEAGFGSDLGMEKFFDIKCRYSGLIPSAVVLVTTIRTLKTHAGAPRAVRGKPVPTELTKEDVSAVEKGCQNLVKHIENARLFGIPVIVAVNCFGTDTDRELAMVERVAREVGAEGAFLSDVWERGGAGAISLAEAVVHASKKATPFRFLYPLDLPIKGKLERIAEQIYGANGVDYSPKAETQINLYAELGLDKLPICMAKTHLSLSHDEKLLGRPRNFRLPVRDVRAAVGAGYLIPLCGDLQTMPALPSVPAGAMIDVDQDGKIKGLF